jgi:hypothetical protein
MNLSASCERMKKVRAEYPSTLSPAGSRSRQGVIHIIPDQLEEEWP